VLISILFFSWSLLNGTRFACLCFFSCRIVFLP
jgi:hypothetical protein